MTGVFLERDPAGLPRPRCVFFLQGAFLDSLVPPAPATRARKTRTGPPVPDRESPDSGEITAVFMRRLLPLLPMDGSVESGDGLAASVESPVVSVPGRVLETSSSSESMPLLFNCYDPYRLLLLVSYEHRKFNAKDQRNANVEGPSGTKFC